MGGDDAPEDSSVVTVFQMQQFVDNDVILQARSQSEDMFGEADPAM